MIVELSTGHVFHRESVVSIGPACPQFGSKHAQFEVIGVGFRQVILASWEPSEPFTASNIKELRQEAIDKLMKGR